MNYYKFYEEDKKMKVFISWSGTLSNLIAQELNKILTPTEYLAIVNVYNSAINRLLRENGLECGR